jgi:sulfatase modifying factor 1
MGRQAPLRRIRWRTDSVYAFADATKSEWYAACSGAGANVYPYGSVYQPGKCNGEDLAVHDAIPVGSASGCQGSVAGLFDMSGNVFEWEDGCDANYGPNDQCRLRGGSWNDNDLQCSFGSTGTTRSEMSGNFGFRCCSQ